MNLADLSASLTSTRTESVEDVASARETRPRRRLSTAGRLRGALRSLKRLLFGALLPPKTRRLRVNETVSLGDKRFISIVAVDGIEYLVGGGSANVALLTRLGPAAAEPNFQAAIAEAWRQTETA